MRAVATRFTTRSVVKSGRGRRTAVRAADAGEHRFTYDATGNVIERRYPDGAVARFGFDLAGRSTSEDWDGDGTAEIVRTWDQSLVLDRARCRCGFRLRASIATGARP